MATAPLIHRDDASAALGFATSLPAPNTAVAIPVPDNALYVVLWAEDADGAMTRFQIGFDQTDTLLTVTDTNLAWQAAMPYQRDFLGYGQGGETYTNRDNYIHVSCPVVATVYGEFGYRYDVD